MAGKKNALGTGMSTLLGTDNAGKAKSMVKNSKQDNSKSTTDMDINKISPNKEQPRKYFNEDALLELSDSIKKHGIIEPLVVSKKQDTRGKEYYQIVAGERRWRAAKEAGLTKVPVVIKEYTEKEILEIALIENIQREDLNPIEEAKAYESLTKELKITQDQLAERVAKSRTAITNAMRLLKLSKKVQIMVIEEQLSAGHARTLLALSDKNKQYEIAQKVFDEGLSVRETEKLVKKENNEIDDPIAKKKKVDSKSEAIAAAYKEKAEEFQNKLNAKVSIEDKGNKGKIIISYESLEDFERITELMSLK